MKYFLVLNPGSHSGRSRKTFNRLFGMLEAEGIEYDYRETRSLDDARKISGEMNGKGQDAIIAVGGDGTINGVINGFYDHEGRRISQTKFGVIYTGTSPDFCKSYNIPVKLDQAVSRLADPRVVSIPVGRITLSENTAAESPVVRYFACCANIGLGAALARRANGGVRKLLGDKAGTFLSLIITLFSYRANPFSRTMDGNIEKLERMQNTSVGLTPYIASGIKISQDPQQKPGTFYCMTVKDLKLKQLIPLINKVYAGKPFANTNYLSVAYCSEVKFDFNELNPEVEFDGDPAGYLPCTITLAKDPLDLIV